MTLRMKILRTASDKILSEKAFNITKNPTYDGHQSGIASIVYNFLSRITLGAAVKSDVILNQEFPEELHKPINKRYFENGKYTHLLMTIFGVLILLTCN